MKTICLGKKRQPKQILVGPRKLECREGVRPKAQHYGSEAVKEGAWPTWCCRSCSNKTILAAAWRAG